MKKVDALGFFKTQTELAEILGVSKATVSGWGELVPYHWQPVIERLTKGKIRAMKPEDFAAARKPKAS